MSGPTWHVIGAASSAGSYGAGQERTPQVLRDHGLLDALADAGVTLVDHGDVVRLRMRPDPEHPEAGHVDLVAAASLVVADHVAEAAAAGARSLVLGGDCTLQLGVVAGLRRGGARVGLLYVDLDADLNTPASADGILDWMGLAHLLGVPGTLPRLIELDGHPPLLEPAQVVLVAVDNLTDAERETIARLDLRRVPLADCLADPHAVVEELRAWAATMDVVSVHVDADVLDERDLKVAHEEREVPGLTVDALSTLVTGFCGYPNAGALTLCEVNPDRPADLDAAFARLVRLLVDAVSG